MSFLQLNRARGVPYEVGGWCFIYNYLKYCQNIKSDKHGNIGHGHKQLKKPLKKWWILRHKANPTGIFRNKLYYN